MQFSTIFIAAATFAGFANAIEFTNTVFNNVTAGEPFTFTWSNATGPVSIELLNGPPTDLQPVSTITSGQSGDSYTWNVPATLEADTYAFRVSDGTSENYSVQTQLIGGASPSASSGTASSTGTVSETESGSVTSTLSGATTSTGTPSNISSTTTGTNTRSTGTASETETETSTRTRATPTPSASGTTAPDAGSSASGLTSNIAMVFLGAAAIFFL